MQLFYLSF